MRTSLAPQAPAPAGTTRLLLWLGVVLVGIPPFLGLSSALSALTMPIAGALAQAITALWFIPEELFPVALVGVVLVLVTVRHEQRAWRLAWLGTALVIIGLVGTSGLAAATGLNRNAEALTGSARTAVAVGMAAFGLVYTLALVGLLVLGLRQLHPSPPALARLGVVVVAVALVMVTFQVIAGILVRRANSPTGAPGAPVVMSGVGDALLWAVLGVVVLTIVAVRLRTLRAPVAATGAVTVIALVVLKVLGAVVFRLSNGPGTAGTATPPAGLTVAMTVSAVVALIAAVALLAVAVRLVARARAPIAPA